MLLSLTVTVEELQPVMNPVIRLLSARLLNTHTHTHTDACIRFKRDVRALAGLNLLKSSHQLGIQSHECGAALQFLGAAAIIGLWRLYHYYYYFNSPVIAGLCSGVGCMGANKSPTLNSPRCVSTDSKRCHN